MAFLNSEIREFWLKNINIVNGKTEKSFIDWILEGKDYIVSSAIQENRFEIYITEPKNLYKAIAFDINKFSSSAFESIAEAMQVKTLPKSNAWKCIKCYYTSYYSAQALLRVMGILCTNFETRHLNKVEQLADLYSFKNGISIKNGYYICRFDANQGKIVCDRNGLNNKGSHELLWHIFLGELNKVTHAITHKKDQDKNDIQDTLLKLLNLKDNLIYMGSNGGNWLSRVRNDISYKHLYGVWYPYSASDKYSKSAENVIRSWMLSPDEIQLDVYEGKMILRFLATCAFLASFLRETLIDMSNRCPSGRSFLKNGCLNLYSELQKAV